MTGLSGCLSLLRRGGANRQAGRQPSLRWLWRRRSNGFPVRRLRITRGPSPFRVMSCNTTFPAFGMMIIVNMRDIFKGVDVV